MITGLRLKEHTKHIRVRMECGGSLNFSSWLHTLRNELIVLCFDFYYLMQLPNLPGCKVHFVRKVMKFNLLPFGHSEIVGKDLKNRSVLSPGKCYTFGSYFCVFSASSVVEMMCGFYLTVTTVSTLHTSLKVSQVSVANSNLN